MVPETSSPSLSFTRMGTSASMRCLRYLTSSKVCSGARFPGFPPGLVVVGSPDALFARQPDERVVVILDGARDLLAIVEFHAYGDFRLDEMLEVSHLFKGLFGSAIPGFSAWSCRSWLS